MDVLIIFILPLFHSPLLRHRFAFTTERYTELMNRSLCNSSQSDNTAYSQKLTACELRLFHAGQVSSPHWPSVYLKKYAKNRIFSVLPLLQTLSKNSNNHISSLISTSPPALLLLTTLIRTLFALIGGCHQSASLAHWTLLSSRAVTSGTKDY